MDWQEMVVRRTLEGAGEHADVQLRFLLQRLERHPETLVTIADAIDEMGIWLWKTADALERRAQRKSADVVRLDDKHDAEVVAENGGEVA